MKYSDFIHVNEGFQTSVNLEYDLNIPEKVKGYIPTEQSVRVLGEFLKSFYYSNDTQSRANVLVGPYGRGKSHLLLVLSAITSLDMFAASKDEREENYAILEELCDKIYSVNEEVGALAREIVQSGIRTLPVIINSNFNDINQSFLLAINDALAKANLQHLLPATYFDSANRLIKYFAEKGLKLDDITLKEWAAKSNTLVNLQLLTGKQNQEKSKSPLVTWIYNQFPDDDKRKKYCEEHYIDFDAGFELENFDAYYNRRREELKKKLMEIFSVQVISEEETRIIEEQTSEEESVITPEGKTIAEVAVSVLIDHPEGLTCKQIYEAIMEQHLYEFKAENPEVVLRIEIRRRCQNVDISKSYETKCFRIVKEVDGECYYGITFSD